MMPSMVAKSGMVTTLRQEADEDRADADAGQGHADGQAHGQHRAEGQDQDDDGEGQAEHLGAGRLELGEDGAAELDLQAVDRRAAASLMSLRDLAASLER